MTEKKCPCNLLIAEQKKTIQNRERIGLLESGGKIHISEVKGFTYEFVISPPHHLKPPGSSEFHIKTYLGFNSSNINRRDLIPIMFFMLSRN